MSAKPFLDTNILIYAVSPHDPRFGRAAGLVADGGLVSVQVLNEFASVAARKLGLPWLGVTKALTDFIEFLPNPRPITLATHRAATVIAAREKFAFFDCVLIASALEAGCRQFFSEDMQDGRVIEGRLTISNPFKAH